MPRPLRAFGEGIFHLTAHASDIRYLFLNDEDCDDFLGRLAAVCRRFDLDLLSYVLMGNHYHVIVRIPDARISHALQLLHTEYSRHHNRRHERSAVSGVGTPWGVKGTSPNCLRSAAEPALPVLPLRRPGEGTVTSLSGSAAI
jgi:REP element-mobilizing transposase RayT